MSISLQQVKCPNCGGPLAGIQASVIVCSFCQAEFNRPAPAPSFRIPTPLPSPPSKDLGLVSVGDLGYRVHGRLAQGAHSDVFLARRDNPLTEMVLLKIARQEAEPLTREWSVLAQLRQKETFLTAFLPQPVAFGVARCQHREDRTAAVYRWRSGFQHTFADARAEYPAGVEPAATVWMWNRLLDQLASLHQQGYAHGALEPHHLLLHPRDHGLILCGWSACQPAPPAVDIAGSGRCIAYLLGAGAPRKLTELVGRAPTFANALELKAELKRVAAEVFGPPRFQPFILTKNNGGSHGIR